MHLRDRFGRIERFSNRTIMRTGFFLNGTGNNKKRTTKMFNINFKPTIGV